MRGLYPSSCEIRCIFSSEGYHIVCNFFTLFFRYTDTAVTVASPLFLESRFIKREPPDNVQSKCPNNDGELLASNFRTINFVRDYPRTALGNHSFRCFGPMSATLSSLIILSRSSFSGTLLLVFWTTYPVRGHWFIHNYAQTKLWSENLNRRDHNWRIRNKIDATYYFILLIIGSTCFGHYYAHH
jgi:hypothetical protein